MIADTSGLSGRTRSTFGVVYRARQSTFDRVVAIKVMSVPADVSTRERLAVECSAIGALSGHPNIVTVYETGTAEDGRPFIVMEWSAPAPELDVGPHRQSGGRSL